MKRLTFILMAILITISLSCSKKKTIIEPGPEPTFSLIITNYTEYNIYIYVDDSYIGKSTAHTEWNAGDFTQSSHTYLKAYIFYDPIIEWEETVNTLGKSLYIWNLSLPYLD